MGGIEKAKYPPYNIYIIMKIKQLLILFIVLYYVPIHAQFSGDFAPSNWTFSSTTTGGDGSINTSGAPASVVLSGSDNDNGAWFYKWLHLLQ